MKDACCSKLQNYSPFILPVTKDDMAILSGPKQTYTLYAFPKSNSMYLHSTYLRGPGSALDKKSSETRKVQTNASTKSYICLLSFWKNIYTLDFKKHFDFKCTVLERPFYKAALFLLRFVLSLKEFLLKGFLFIF